jgi:hypothetical protein
MDGSSNRSSKSEKLDSPEPLSASTPGAGHRSGRRALPDHLRTDPFSLRLTREERHIVEAAATRSGTAAPATWARGVLVTLARVLADEPAAPSAAPPGTSAAARGGDAWPDAGQVGRRPRR